MTQAVKIVKAECKLLQRHLRLTREGALTLAGSETNEILIQTCFTPVFPIALRKIIKYKGVQRREEALLPKSSRKGPRGGGLGGGGVQIREDLDR